MIEDVLKYNRGFVERGEYEQYKADKYPQRKLAIVSCMDTRLTKLLPAAMGFENGDAIIIKNAGGVVSHPYGSVVRSLLVAILELGVEEVMVVGHTDCGVCGLSAEDLLDVLRSRGVSDDIIEIIRFGGIDYDRWLGGFDTVEGSVSDTVEHLKIHPLIPKDVTIRGFVMDVVTGELTEI